MKTVKFTYTLITLLCSLMSTQAQKLQYDARGYISPNYTIHYLTMGMVQKYNLEGKNEVELSPKYLEMITKSFEAIKNSKQPNGGRIMPYNSMNQVIVVVKDANTLKNKAIRKLMKKYNLEYKASYPNDGTTFKVYRKKDFNVKALVTLLKTQPGIKNAYVASNGIAGSGSRVSLTLSGNLLKVTFGSGYGDCPAGCINWIYRKYEVNTDTYTVKYLGKTKTGSGPDLDDLKKKPIKKNKKN